MDKTTKDLIGTVIAGIGIAGLTLATVAAEEKNQKRRANYNKQTISLEDAMAGVDTRVRVSDSALAEIARALRIHQDKFVGVERDQLLTVMFVSWDSSIYSLDHQKCPTAILRALSERPLVHRAFCEKLKEQGVESFQYGRPRNTAQFLDNSDMAKIMELAKDYVC